MPTVCETKARASPKRHNARIQQNTCHPDPARCRHEHEIQCYAVSMNWRLEKDIQRTCNAIHRTLLTLPGNQVGPPMPLAAASGADLTTSNVRPEAMMSKRFFQRTAIVTGGVS